MNYTKNEIVPSLIHDVEALEQLVNSAYRGDLSKQGWTTEANLLDGSRIDIETLQKLIKKPGTIILKYVVDAQILGCVQLDKVESSLYLGMLTVQPKMQDKGIGKDLMRAAEAEAEKLICNRIYMTVISVRTELISWYIRRGYKDTGQRKPFDFKDPRFGTPKQSLEFIVLEKQL